MDIKVEAVCSAGCDPNRDSLPKKWYDPRRAEFYRLLALFQGRPINDGGPGGCDRYPAADPDDPYLASKKREREYAERMSLATYEPEQPTEHERDVARIRLDMMMSLYRSGERYPSQWLGI